MSFLGVFLLCPLWVAYEYWHLTEVVISKWMWKSCAGFSPFPSVMAPSPKCICVFWGICLTQGQMFLAELHDTSWFCLQVRKDQSLVSWKEWGGIELIIIGMCQTKANKKLVWSLMSQSDLFPDFGRWWSQDNYVFYLFPSTELQLPPAENNDY